MLSWIDDGVPVLKTNERRRRALLMPLVVAVAIAVVALIAGLTGRDGSQLVGSGSTLAQPLVEKAAAEFQSAAAADNPERRQQTGTDWAVDGGCIDYEAVGSLGGIMRLRSGAVDFAVSDYPLSADALSEDGLAQFPVAVGAVALVHNLELPAGQQLHLDAETVAAIYLGEISTWNDPLIAALNPDLALPGQAIVPVHRADGSGSTFGFTGWLAANAEAWPHGVGAVVSWSPGLGSAVERTGGVLDEVAATPGAIGYLDHSQAARAGLAQVAVENSAGEFTTATSTSMSAAISAADWSGQDGFTTTITAGTDPQSYPITVAIYALLPAEQSSSSHQVLSFLTHLIDEADATASSLGYLPLPAEAAASVKSYWHETFGYSARS